MMQIFFWLFGIAGIFLFHIGINLSIYVSVMIFVLAAGCLGWTYRKARVGPLIILLFVVYSLPFIHIIPYLWYDFESKGPLLFWQLTLNPYMTDKAIVELMSMIGAVGTAGFMAGALLFQRKLPIPLLVEDRDSHSAHGKTLSLPFFFVWITFAIGFTWINAPQETIFTAAYTQSNPLNQNWNFSSAWMVSYAFLLFAFADSIFEKSAGLRKLKRKIVLIAFLVIVIWFQLLRGDRESIPCVFAALLMYFIWGKDFSRTTIGKIKKNWLIILAAGCFIVVISYFVGVVRSTSVGVHGTSDFLTSGQFRFDNLFSGTWSGGLLTPISVAGDYVNGKLPINYGQTYLGLFASIVPGFLADWIGYVRPIDGLHGPAWQMTYGIGGTHAVVVPFMNFGIAGVFIIIALWSFLFAKVERWAVERMTVSKLALLGIIAMAAPHWLWYGEKYVMNALIIWFILSILYRLRWVNDGINSAGQECKSF